jgi:hypothetical protein
MKKDSRKGEIVTLLVIVATIISGIASLASLSLLNGKKTIIKTKAEGGWNCPGGNCDKCGQEGLWIRSDGCGDFCNQRPNEPNCIAYNQKQNPTPTLEVIPTTVSPIIPSPTVSTPIPTEKPQQKRCQYDDSWSCDNDCTGGSACYPCGDGSYECRTIETPFPTQTFETKPTPSQCERCMRENSPSECIGICRRYPIIEPTIIIQETPQVTTTLAPTITLLKTSDLPPCTQCDDDQKCKYYPELDKRGGSHRFGCTDTGCTSDSQCKGYKSLINKDTQKYVVPSDFNLELKQGVYYVEGLGLLDCIDATLCTVGLKQTSYIDNTPMPYGQQHYDMTNVDKANSVPYTIPPQLNPMINPKLINGILVQGDKFDEPTHDYSDYRPVPIGKAIDFKAPNFTTLIDGDKNPRITNLYSICQESDNGCKALRAPTSPKNIAMIGLSVPSDKIVRLPAAGRNIDPNNNAMVLYVCPGGDCVVLKYTPSDDIYGGYTLTLRDGIKVDPNLFRAYQQADKAGRNQLPGVKNLQALGITNGRELKVTIRDQSEWMDPRSENDWWGKRPPGLKDETVLMP